MLFVSVNTFSVNFKRYGAMKHAYKISIYSNLLSVNIRFRPDTTFNRYGITVV